MYDPHVLHDWYTTGGAGMRSPMVQQYSAKLDDDGLPALDQPEPIPRRMQGLRPGRLCALVYVARVIKHHAHTPTN